MAKKASQTTNEQTQAPEQGAQTEAPKASGLKLTPVGKITVKTVFGVVPQKDLPPLRVNLSDENPEGDANPNPEVKLCRIVGFASGVKRGDSSYGPWAALVGEFAATNAQTGEVFGSRTAIIPGPMGEALVTSTEQALQEDADSKVRFSCDVFVKRSARDPARKYEYVVRPVIDAKLSSPAVELLGLEG
jgi:hypothetical protein